MGGVVYLPGMDSAAAKGEDAGSGWCPGRDKVCGLVAEDAWVWDIYRASRFVKSVHVVTFKDVNVEELTKLEMDIPSS